MSASFANSDLNWDEKYDDQRRVYGTIPNEWMTHACASLNPGARVLSVGEGEGSNVVWLGARGARVTAVDGSEAALTKARALAREARVELETVCDDAAAFEPGDSCWDAVLLLHVHLDPRVRRVVHRRLARALAPGGLIVLEALRPSQIARAAAAPSRIELYYTREMLESDFNGVADILTLQESTRMIAAGEHRGLTDVVSMTASR